MVSMVFILFLLAVLVCLCVGRLAQILLTKMKERTIAPPRGRRLLRKPQGRIAAAPGAEVTSGAGISPSSPT
jgi:hypothetical protein